MEEHNNLQITSEAKEFLREIAKWAYFLSIVGYVMIGFIVLAAFFMGSLMSSMGSLGGEMGTAGMLGGTFVTVLYLLIAVLYFFPVYYLNKFSSNLKAALQQNDSEALSTSLGFLKSHYKFIGILTIVMLSIYAIIFLFGIIGAVAAFA